MSSSLQTAISRGLAALLVTAIIVPTGAVRAAPGDIFSIPAPVIGADPPKASELRDGDVSVATATGAVTYSYPIAVPPGRNGMAPSLALSYSSQAPIYGGVAAGWSLSIGMIREDTSGGRLATHDPLVEPLQGDAKQDDRFVSSIAGESRLVAVDEPKLGDVYRTYRVAHGDSTFSRYERLFGGQSARWRVRTTDGSTMLFGETANAPGCPIHDGFAPLTRATDSFGNEVKYEYVFAEGECMITRISWGQNANAGLARFAEVNLSYHRAASCNGVPVGSQTSYRDGRAITTGTNEILGISAKAFEPGTSTIVHSRAISLTYEGTSCTAQHAPARLLHSIQETASGIDSPSVTSPAIIFEYGDSMVSLSTPTTAMAGFTGPRPHNLGWGKRRSDDLWPTVEAMMLDIDGDGLIDRVTNISTPETDGQCRARWQRNNGPDLLTGIPTFGSVQDFTLPRIKWLNGGTLSGANEGCALNGQFTKYRNSKETIGVCHDASSSACVASSNPDDDSSYCGPNGTTCPKDPGTGSEPFTTYLAYRWLDMDSDGLVDLVAAVHGDIDWYDIEMGNRPTPGLAEPPLFGPWPSCPGAPTDRCQDLSNDCATQNCPLGGECTANPGVINTCLGSAATVGCHDLIAFTGGGGGGVTVRSPYMRCEGLYPWFIYKNTGNGAFAPNPVIKYQPVPLESDHGDSGFGTRSLVTQHHGIIDFDGDGRLDAVIHPQTTNLPWWHVFLGDGSGGFGPKLHLFQTRPDTMVSGIGVTGGSPSSTLGLFDINGDGLLDQWQMAGSGGSNIALHYGTKHRMIGSANGPVGELNTADGVRPANDSTTQVTNPPNWGPPNPIIEGNTRSANRVVDVDNDGRQDIVKLPSSGTPQVHFNVGGQFASSSVGYPGDVNGLERRAKGVQDPGIVWELSSDLIDIDGDGIAESVWFAPTITRVVHGNATPPRLLKRITNGRGLVTSLSYSSMHDKNVVEQNPQETWFDGRPKATPNTQWVVKSMIAVDEFAGTTSTASYRYKNPRHGADDEGYFAFRGFEEVTTTSPSNAKTVERYAFDVDWSGRLAETRVHPAEAPGEARSITKQQYQPHSLFSGAVKVILPTVSEHFTCANGQTIGACTLTPNAAAAYTKTTTTHASISSIGGGPNLLYVASSTLLEGPAPADGDRRTENTFALLADASTYRLRPLISQRARREGTNWPIFAKSAKTWDPTFRVSLTEEVWFDNVDAHRAITRLGYDMTTGNVVERFKPEQDGTGDPKTTFEYDDRKLFVDLVQNELGHQVESFYEYGTGTKLETRGPNTDADGAKQRQRIRIDGFGRTLEEYETISLSGTNYSAPQLIATTSYVEANLASTPHTPASATTSSRIRHNSPGWTQAKSEVDGHGRPLKQTVFVQGSAPNDHVTTFTYRNDGTLQSVTVPDPSQNNASTVSYAYTFDSLGRPTSIRRPDAPVNKSGVDIAYDGVTKTDTEVVGDAGGQVASTKTIADRFGRLLEVQEKTSDSPPTWAITHYTYGADDAVTTIVDPQGVTTALTHDFAGRRTQIARHGRVWSYSYDRNGNLTSEQVPGSPNPPFSNLDYTTTIVYDALDRPVEKLVGQRALSPTDQQAFGARMQAMVYDAAPNAVGRLVTWSTFAPNAVLPMNSQSLSYDAQGNVTNDAQTFRGAEYANLQRSFYREWNLLGAPTLTRYRDQVGGTNKTESNHLYDLRGLPLKIELIRTGEPNLDIATQTRNVAGLVTARTTALSGPMAPLGSVGSSWTYDKLGRVIDQNVLKVTGTPKAYARQQLVYFGNDDPSSLTHTLGTSAKVFQFGYDKRHQLSSANETTTSGYFASSYQYGTAGRLANVNIAQPTPPAGSELDPRNVSYQYADPDPERVTALLFAGSSTRYATYQYDDAGNQISRCYGPTFTPACTGESMDFVYDGNDQLRRAVKKLNGIVVASEEYFYMSGQRFAVVARDAAGAKTELTWFIGDTEAHYDGAGTVTHAYSHLSLGTPVARVDRTSNTITALELQFHGLANSTLASVSSIGTSNIAFSYSPFGEVLEATGSGATQRRRFNDKQEDATTGLGYYGARYFDKNLIGWTQADPLYLRVPDAALLSTPRRANVYVFTLQNPLRYIDPDGMDPTRSARNAKSATTCTPGVMGVGCERDASPAAYDGETNWLKTGKGLPSSDYQDRLSEWKSEMVSAVLADSGLNAAPNVDATYIPPQVFEGRGGIPYRPRTFRRTPPIRRVIFRRPGSDRYASVNVPTGVNARPSSSETPPIVGPTCGPPDAPTHVHILKPGGFNIGERGDNSGVRILQGGLGAAQQLFQRLSVGGKVVEGTTYPGTLVRHPNGDTIGLRPSSKSGFPTIDVQVTGVGVRELKFR